MILQVVGVHWRKLYLQIIVGIYSNACSIIDSGEVPEYEDY